MTPVSGTVGDFGHGTVRRVEGGWQYIDGSVWPSQAALRDALVVHDGRQTGSIKSSSGGHRSRTTG